MTEPNKAQRRLLEMLGRLPADKAELVREFVEFLNARYGRDGEILEPVDIPRPQDETVVRAIKRLRASYPMLDAAKLLPETSELMTQHAMGGRDRVAVIDELELVFRRHYEKRTSK